MRWYRMYHGTCTDPKLIGIADMAKVKRSVALAAWVAVLEMASSSSDRGSIKHVSTRSLSVHIGEGIAVCERVLKAFIDASMIENGRVSAWDKRQPISDDSAPRQQNFRERRRNEQSYNPLNLNKTLSKSNVTVTPLRTDTDTDIKESIKDSPPHIPPNGVDKVAPDGAPAANAARNGGGQFSFMADNQSLNSKAAVKPPKPSSKELDTAFEAFWAEVPTGKKFGKEACRRKVRSIISSGRSSSEELLAKMREYASGCEASGIEKSSIKLPETWLNKQCYLDEEQFIPKPAQFMQRGSAQSRDPETGLRYVCKTTKMFLDIMENGPPQRIRIGI